MWMGVGRRTRVGLMDARALTAAVRQVGRQTTGGIKPTQADAPAACWQTSRRKPLLPRA